MKGGNEQSGDFTVVKYVNPILTIIEIRTIPRPIYKILRFKFILSPLTS